MSLSKLERRRKLSFFREGRLVRGVVKFKVSYKRMTWPVKMGVKRVRECIQKLKYTERHVSLLQRQAIDESFN